MPSIQETAYPRLKSAVSAADLAAIYTTTPEELVPAKQVTRSKLANLGFLILLKTFQRLGYFVPISQVPLAIAEHIAAITGAPYTPVELADYDLSGTRRRHGHVIRQFLQVQCYGKEARHTMLNSSSRFI